MPERAGIGAIDGYGTAETEAVARRKALSEAVERLVACTSFGQIARPPVPDAGPEPGSVLSASGVRSRAGSCAMRRYAALTGSEPELVPLFWSSPWVAGEELRAGNVVPSVAKTSSTVGWAVAGSPAAALRGALFELIELLNYGAFLYRCLSETNGQDRGAAPAGREEPGVQLVPIAIAIPAATVLAVSRGPDRAMPATGLGAAPTVAQASERAVGELTQAETMWRANTTAIFDERLFLNRFEPWPTLLRCARLDFGIRNWEPAPAPAAGSPLQALSERDVAVWADVGAIDLASPDLGELRLYHAHVVSHPQPLLGLIRAGVPVFDAKEVRDLLDRPCRPVAGG
jgi:hypothetical protein